MNLIVRDYTEADRESLKQMIAGLIDHMSVIDPHKRFRPRADLDTEKYIRNKLENMDVEKGKIILAEQDGRLVGYVALTIGDTKGTDDEINKFPFKQGNIDDVYVEDGHRGQGIARALIESAEDYFRSHGCDYSGVPCLASNEAARKAYAAYGYAEQYIDFLKKL